MQESTAPAVACGVCWLRASSRLRHAYKLGFGLSKKRLNISWKTLEIKTQHMIFNLRRISSKHELLQQHDEGYNTIVVGACSVYHRKGVVIYARWKHELRGKWRPVDELASISGSRNRRACQQENNRACRGTAAATRYREVMSIARGDGVHFVVEG